MRVSPAQYLSTIIVPRVLYRLFMTELVVAAWLEIIPSLFVVVVVVDD